MGNGEWCADDWNPKRQGILFISDLHDYQLDRHLGRKHISEFQEPRGLTLDPPGCQFATLHGFASDFDIPHHGEYDPQIACQLDRSSSLGRCLGGVGE